MTQDPGTTPRPASTSPVDDQATDGATDGPGAGRPVILTPMPPGLWLIIGGAVVAALGPLFGFLIGSMMGSDTETGALDPIYLMLFLGIMVGGLGVGAMLLGARTMLRNRN
jgi:hypothetical protein